MRWAGPTDDPDRYRLLSLLSTGGEGEVWLADRSEAGTPFRYAVKVLHPHLTDSPQVRQQMSLQTALLTQLEHPALVKVREAFAGPAPHEAGAAERDGQRLYLVMKWIDGQSLADLVAGGGVTGAAGIRPLREIAAALDYLHSGRDTGGEPVLHRDVKPQNILVTEDNRAYLVDFGLARLAETPTMSRLSGTVAFMAPESLYQGHYTAASDRYSFAATVYHALVGEAPAPGRGTQRERLRRALPARASRRLVDAVLAGLDPEPDRRPATAVAIVRGLDPSAAAETVDAPRRRRRKPTQPSGPQPQPGGPPPRPGAVPPPPAQPYAPPPPPWPVYPYPYPYHRPFPVRRKRTWAPLIIVLVMLGVIGSCGYGVLELLKATSGTTGDSPRTGATTGARAAGPSATRRPADAGPPPPVAAALQPVLISKAEIMAIWKVSVLSRRMVAVAAADRLFSALTVGLPLGLAALAHAVPGSAGLGRPAAAGGPAGHAGEAQQLLVVLVVGAVFMGMSAGIRELVGERPCYERERAVGLSPVAYLTSKVLVLGLLGTLQAAVFVLVALLGRPGPADALVLRQPTVELIAVVAAVTITSTATGLLVSATVRTAEQVMPLLVGWVMAQLVLCGGLFTVVGRPGLEQLSWLAPARWGYAAAAATVDIQAGTAGPARDSLWRHSAGAWLAAVGVLAVIAVATLLITRRVLARGARPG